MGPQSKYGSLLAANDASFANKDGPRDHSSSSASQGRWLIRAIIAVGFLSVTWFAVAAVNSPRGVSRSQNTQLADLHHDEFNGAQAQEPEYAYLKADAPALKLSSRIPHSLMELKETTPSPSESRKKVSGGLEVEGATHYRVNLYDHPKVKEAFENIKDTDQEEAMRVCMGPEPNIDVFVDPEGVQGDLTSPPGYNVFALDCRGIHGGQYKLVGFVMVMDMRGGIVNIMDTRKTGVPEGISMFNTTTVLFTTGTGVYHWNYLDDYLEQLPFVADSHTLVYRASDDKYFGLFADEAALEQHAPQVAVTFDGKTGKNPREDPLVDGWSFYYPESHFNYLTIGGDAAYCSSRSLSSLIKVDMTNNEIKWNLGGANSDFTVYDTEGNAYIDSKSINKKEYEKMPWGHQHKFQYLGDNVFTLFDNNVGTMKMFLDKGGEQGESSRLVVLRVDEKAREAHEVFSYIIGDSARSYGGTEILPSGNVLANSYVDWVYPLDPDHQYHVNLWEVSPVTHEVVWRVGFKGLNLQAPEDTENPYPHFINDPFNPDVPPVGWNIYTVDRFYSTVAVSAPCRLEEEQADGTTSTFIRFVPYNTVRTQEDRPGRAMLSVASAEDALVISVLDFDFQRGWLARSQRLEVPAAHVGAALLLTVNNEWGDYMTLELALAELGTCGPEREDGYRAFWTELDGDKKKH